MDRDTLLRLIGPLPERPPLDVVLVEEVDCGTYRRRRLSFAVEAGERIPAFLCLPKDRPGPLPAVLCLHQYGGDHALGKSEVVGLAGDPDQAYAAELAERGFVTLAADAICFEERAHPQAPFAWHVHQLSTRLLQGRTLLAKVLSDVSVGIDLLAATPEVDAGRSALSAIPTAGGRRRSRPCSTGG